MRLRLTALLIALALLMPLAIIGVRRLTAREQPVTEYATRAEAEAAGAFARGWLPALLPRSAHTLREVHDLDTNARWLRFRADSLELATLAARLAPITPAEATRDAARRPRTAGADWPSELGGMQLATARGARQLALVRDSTEAYCLAIEWRTARAWGWSCAREQPGR